MNMTSEVFKSHIAYIEEQYDYVLDDVVRHPSLQMHDKDHWVVHLDLPFRITKSEAKWAAMNFFGEKKDIVKVLSIISGVSYSPEGESKEITRIELEF